MAAGRATGSGRRARPGLLAAGLTALLFGAGGCDDAPPPRRFAEAPPAWTPARTREAEAIERLVTREPGDPAGLRVQLGFGAHADLDLYVTDPFEETVYHANTPSRSGGELLEDRRCVHEAPRVETVRFSPPLAPGRYRVGVDYSRACDDAKEPAPFAVAVDGPGGRTTRQGLARHHVFEPIVLEFEVDPASAARAGQEVSR